MVNPIQNKPMIQANVANEVLYTTSGEPVAILANSRENSKVVKCKISNTLRDGWLDFQNAGVDKRLERSLGGRVKGHVLASLRALKFGISRNARGKIATLLNKRPEFCELNAGRYDTEWKENSSGLVLMLHGLRGHPAQFDSHVRSLRKHENLDVKVPFILEKGDCSVEDMLEPLKQMIDEYITTQNKDENEIKISLVGISNGGRLSIKLTEWLKESHPDVQLLTLASAPVLHGTGIADSIGFRMQGFSESVKEDFKYENKDKEWVHQATSDLPANFKVRTFIGLEDSLVFPTTACLVGADNLTDGGRGKTTNYFYKNQGHTSILMGSEKDQMRKLGKHFNLAHN